jgi:hypothetical protein
MSKSSEQVNLDEFPEQENEKEAANLKKEPGDYHKVLSQFKISKEEKLVHRFRCSLEMNHGWIFITTNYIFFYSKFPSTEMRKVSIEHIAKLEKRKAAKVIPNSILIRTKNGVEILFSNFIHRDRAFEAIEMQRMAVEEAKMKSIEDKNKQEAQANDKMVESYRTLNKIQASDYVKELEEELGVASKSSTCSCTIL